MNDLETHVLEMIGENTDSPDVFTDDSAGMAQIRESLNDAIEEICMVTGSHKRTYKMPLRKGAHIYRVNFTRGKLAWITGMWLYGKSYRLEQKDFNYFRDTIPMWLSDTGTPERYCQIGDDTLCLHPAPDGSSDFIEIEAVVIPNRYTEDTDRIHLRDSFRWAAVKFAVSEYYASRGDAKSANDWYYQYLVELGFQEIYPETGERAYAMGQNKNSDSQISA